MEDVLKTVLRDDGAVEEMDTEEWDENCWMDEVFNGGWRMVDVLVDDWLMDDWQMNVEDRWGNDGVDEGIIPELEPPLWEIIRIYTSMVSQFKKIRNAI